jgi:hypothetical protein
LNYRRLPWRPCAYNCYQPDSRPASFLLTVGDPPRPKTVRTTMKIDPTSGEKVFLACVVGAVMVVAPALWAQPNRTGEQVSSSGLELPAMMRQSVRAGKTTVGTKVQARLTVATLVGGAVIPDGATLSGEVIESSAKSSTEPSRLAIRMDSLRWKNGERPIEVYLTAWYYPLILVATDPADDTLDPIRGSQRRAGAGPYPDPNTSASPPIPHGADESDRTRKSDSKVTTSRQLMKNVESMRNANGKVVLTSTRSNIKIDRAMTYVFMSADLAVVNSR